MTCDICHNPIKLNVEGIVIDEKPTKDPDVTSVTYMAHAVCHQPQQEPIFFNPMTDTYNGGNIFWRPA